MNRLAALLLLALPLAAADLRQLQVDSFDRVWTVIRERHWDAELVGAAWEKARDELRPRVEHAATPAEARAAIGELLGRLGHSHVGIIPAEAWAGMEPAGRRRDGSIGIDVRVIGGAALVVAVQPGSSAEEAGVRPGWEILRIDGQEVAPLLAAVPAAVRGRTHEGAWAAARVMNRLAGPAGSLAEVDFRAEGDRQTAVAIPRTSPRGTVFRFGFLPPMYVWTETRRLPGGVGYFAFNAFLDPGNFMREAEKAISGCGDCRGFIVDLRGNMGGLGAMTMGLAGWFAEKPGRLGTLRTRQGAVHLFVSPRAEVFRGPLAVLVDAATGSSAEIFAGGMQALGRARVFGTVTAGSALPAQIEKLPSGDALLYAIGDYVAEGGRRLEGAGVRPDVEAAPTREALLAGRDPALEAALQWIRTEKAGIR